MAKKKVNDRNILALILNENTKSNYGSLTGLKLHAYCVMTQLAITTRSYDRNEVSVETIEEGSEALDLGTEGINHFSRTPLGNIEMMIQVMEHKGKLPTEKISDKADTKIKVIIGTGSLEYCAAIIHLISMNSIGLCDSWGMRLLRALIGQKNGTAVSFDSKKPHAIKRFNIERVYAVLHGTRSEMPE